MNNIKKILLGSFGTNEILLIIILALLLFGGKKIPEFMRGLGNGVREFRKATKNNEETDEIKNNEEKKL